MLEKDADLALYTTSIAMDDLDEVREALGYGKIDVVAASYGSIAAQAYIRQHGERVRAAFLTGVATPGIKQPLPFARGAQEALELLYRDCDTDDACRKAFPKLQQEFATVLARFDRGALDVRMIDPATGKEKSVKLERESYVERLRLMLYTTTFASFVPCIVHSAFQGDWVPFESVAIAYNPGSILSRGMYMTITCSEGVPFITDAEIREQTRGTFVGERRVRAHQEACREWVRGNVPASFIEPVRSPVPVLMFSGEADGSTPQWLGEEAVKYLSHGRQIEVKHYGHQVDSPCMWKVMDQFIRTASVGDLDTSCVAGIHRPPFATEIPAAFSLAKSAAPRLILTGSALCFTLWATALPSGVSSIFYIMSMAPLVTGSVPRAAPHSRAARFDLFLNSSNRSICPSSALHRAMKRRSTLWLRAMATAAFKLERSFQKKYAANRSRQESVAERAFTQRRASRSLTGSTEVSFPIESGPRGNSTKNRVFGCT